MEWVAQYWSVISSIGLLLVTGFSWWLRQTTVSRREHEKSVLALREAIETVEDNIDATKSEIASLKTRIGAVATRDDIHSLQLEIEKVNGTMNTLQATFEGFASSMQGVQRIADLIQEKAIKGGPQ